MQTEKTKGFKSWMHRNFSQEPVLISDVKLDQRIRKLENELHNQGHFGAKINYELHFKKSNHKKASVSYHVLLPQAYTVNSVSLPEKRILFDSLPPALVSESIIESERQYDLENVLAERDRITSIIRNEGYYSFRKEYLEFSLDTTKGTKSIDMGIDVYNNLPDLSTKKYTIHDITFIMLNNAIDSLSGISLDTLSDEIFTIVYEDLFVKPSIMKHAVYQIPGQKYTQRSHEYTQEHLGNLGVFKQIDISYDTLEGFNNKLRMNILLLPLEKISLSAEANVVTKSTGFVGPAVVARLTNQNLFGGAEKLNISLNAGYEWQIFNAENTGLGFNSYELGIKSSISFPKIIAPFGLKYRTNIYVPKTTVSAGFEILNRVRYYKMNSISTSYSYQWKESLYNQHSFSLIDINFVDLVDTTAEFSEIFLNNPSVRRSFEEQFIVGMRYRFSFDNSSDENKTHRIYWESGLVTAGNFLSLIDKNIMGNTEEEQGKLFGKPYSQFLKITQDLRHYYKFRQKSGIVDRLYIGFGYPYGNSTVMPYVEQFFSGGANSIRGFTARSIGPGEYRGDTLTYFDQTGDIKIEYNFEYRFRIGQRLFGATFLDVGNIWLHKEDPLRPGSGFQMDKFYKQLAFGTGFGFRFDIDFFVIRFDIGIPLRNPGYEKGRQWVFTNSEIFKLNGFIAIGYPF